MKVVFKIIDGSGSNNCSIFYIETKKFDLFVDNQGYYTPDDFSGKWAENKSLRYIFRNCK